MTVLGVTTSGIRVVGSTDQLFLCDLDQDPVYERIADSPSSLFPHQQGKLMRRSTEPFRREEVDLSVLIEDFSSEEDDVIGKFPAVTLAAETACSEGVKIASSKRS